MLPWVGGKAKDAGYRRGGQLTVIGGRHDVWHPQKILYA